MIKPKFATVLQNCLLSCDTFLMKLKVNLNPSPLPTQFVLLDTYPYKYLLKPFTVVEYKNNVLTIIYRVISDGTRYISTLSINDKIITLGPFGNTEIINQLLLCKNKNLVFIVGGSGVASVIFLYRELYKKNNNIIVFYGERTKKYVVNLANFGMKKVVYSTDDGSFGKKGLVTNIAVKSISAIKPDYIFLCGPKGMIRSSMEFVKKFPETKFYVLMEEYMCCGIGICRSCVVKIKQNNTDFIYQTVCKDGPLFDMSKLQI